MPLYVDHQGPFHAIGSDGPLVVALMKRPIDGPLGVALGEVLGRTLRAHGNHIVYLHVTSLDTGGAADIAEVRKHYGDLMARFSGTTGAIAFVAENEGFAGALIRSAFTAVMAMGRSTIVGKAFSEVKDAAEWIEGAGRDKRVPNVPLARTILEGVASLRSIPTASRPR